MSRLVGRPVEVICDNGVPVAFRLNGPALITPAACPPVNGGQELQVIGLVAHWREWIGVLDGEPERDVWQVETPHGTCELHCLRHPNDQADEPGENDPGEWLLYRWDD
jgi:hypothetical protein